MSLRELKEEFKQAEGDPAIKGKLKQVRHSKARKRMIANVPKAAVVITHPTHYSIALQYKRGMEAPVCVVKGVDPLPSRSGVAEEHSIPIVENPPLARAARHRRGPSADPGRTLQGGGRGDRLRHAAAPDRRAIVPRAVIKTRDCGPAGSCAGRAA